jgi:hypothetical protein
MFSFTFNDRYFFDREELDNRWRAHTCIANPPVRQAYFAISDGKFIRHACDDHKFTPKEISDIECFLRENAAAMTASQFDPHFQLPNHYRLINPASNRFADIMQRLRTCGEWDVNTSVALEVICTKNPAFRLTRSFIKSMLDVASNVSEHDHDEWLREVAMDHWTYDQPGPRPPFEEFFLARKKAIYQPDPTRVFDSDTQELYEIDGIPSLYYLEETTSVPNFHEPLIDSRHFVDLGSVVAPVSLPVPNHKPCFII